MSDLFFSRLQLEDWRQFRKIDLKFDKKLTIITGSNGSGKSTILKILAQHFGWSSAMLGTPWQNKSGQIMYRTGTHGRRVDVQENRDELGSIEYSSGHDSRLWVPAESGIQFNVNFDSIATVDGINIQAHRPPPVYSAVSTIPTNALQAESAYNNYYNEVRGRESGSYNVGGTVFRMKEAIISMAMFGPGNVNVAPNDELNKTFVEFNKVLSKLLPRDIGFKKISIRLPDVILETASGDFLIDAASGGLMSLIELSWQIFLFSRNHQRFTVLIDEPENHLHPTMQREVLSSLVGAFPSAQFIVATHSPFIISALKRSRVYVLRTSQSGKNRSIFVDSEELNLDDKAGTANEILRDVLGVPVTLPIWAASDLERIAAIFSRQSLTREAIDDLRNKLSRAGLSEFYPDALARIAEQ